VGGRLSSAAAAVHHKDVVEEKYLCLAINATITPSPFTVAQEGQNVTLTCVVSQRRRNSALPVVKWTFLPAGTERPEDELLIARVNMRKARFYGNYTKSFTWPKMKLTVVKHGKVFELLILNVSEDDRGLYLCRVQEFRKHQDRWRAASNCTAATEKSTKKMYSFFNIRLYVYKLIVGSLRDRALVLLKDSYLLKSPHNSSGETVTSEANVSPALPKKERRYRKKRSKGLQEELPPEIPFFPSCFLSPRLLPFVLHVGLQPRIVEENLTYAELELIKPLPEMKAACSGTVYAQILFKEQKL
uniref:V-set and transmembrane domain containing 4b n=1 Tax=Oryzias melastigma TaxID=30732 RepID=A0A3B3BRJ7_ORYME